MQTLKASGHPYIRRRPRLLWAVQNFNFHNLANSGMSAEAASPGDWTRVARRTEGKRSYRGASGDAGFVYHRYTEKVHPSLLPSS